MATFLDIFPKVQYDITRNKHSEYQTVTNLLFRFNIIKSIISNISTYYVYTIKDSDTPEILAEKLYKDPESYWILLYANNIYDPQFDWPLNSAAFSNYLIDKYGSIQYAQTNIHHYEKVIERTESSSGITTTTRFEINYDKLSDDDPSVPYDYYLSLPETQSVTSYDLDGKTVTEVYYRNEVTFYDYENELNESRRQIKIIKPEYYRQIIKEFNNITGNGLNPFLRTLT